MDNQDLNNDDRKQSFNDQEVQTSSREEEDNIDDDKINQFEDQEVKTDSKAEMQNNDERKIETDDQAAYENQEEIQINEVCVGEEISISKIFKKLNQYKAESQPIESETRPAQSQVRPVQSQIRPAQSQIRPVQSQITVPTEQITSETQNVTIPVETSQSSAKPKRSVFPSSLISHYEQNSMFAKLNRGNVNKTPVSIYKSIIL